MIDLVLILEARVVILLFFNWLFLCLLPEIYFYSLLVIRSSNNLQVVNSRGDVLKCSHYVPIDYSEGKTLPCVIYCHGNRLVDI